jgi:hypothetical protein
MAQILTVSPTTAAYASDAYKPNTSKAGAFNPMAEAIIEWHDKALASGNVADRALLTFVTPPSLALTFLTVEPHKLPQTTEKQATAEYKSNS